MELLLVVFDLGALALGFRFLRGPSRPGRELLVGLALGALLGGAAFAYGKLLSNHFVILRLWCHLIFCVLAPLALWRAWIRGGVLRGSVLVLFLVAEGCYVWARRVEPFRLEITRHRIVSERLRGARQALRVAVLADLQTDTFGAFERRVFEALAAEKPDLLLVPGDLLQLGPGRSEAEWEEAGRKLAEHFARVPPPRLGAWFVQGDCDAPMATFEGTGLRRLDDEAVVFEEERLQLVGLTLGNARRRVPPELVAQVREHPGLSLLVAHAPDFALHTAELGVPVVNVAGHTHGGQVQLPWFGPPITVSRIPRHMAAGGLFALGDSWLCVSRGLGMERDVAPRIRFLCRPELVILELLPPP